MLEPHKVKLLEELRATMDRVVLDGLFRALDPILSRKTRRPRRSRGRRSLTALRSYLP